MAYLSKEQPFNRQRFQPPNSQNFPQRRIPGRLPEKFSPQQLNNFQPPRPPRPPPPGVLRRPPNYEYYGPSDQSLEYFGPSDYVPDSPPLVGPKGARVVLQRGNEGQGEQKKVRLKLEPKPRSFSRRKRSIQSKDSEDHFEARTRVHLERLLEAQRRREDLKVSRGPSP